MHNYTLQTKNPSVALGGFGQVALALIHTIIFFVFCLLFRTR